VFLPYLAGSSAPHWNPDATGAFLGLTHRAGRAVLGRAVLEGVALELRQILDAFTALGLPSRELRLTGGYTCHDTLHRLLADATGRTVTLLEQPEATLIGAAILAATGAGAFPSVQAAAAGMVRLTERFAPAPEARAAYDALARDYGLLADRLHGANLLARRLSA